MFCKITSGEYSLFLWWFCHWSECLVIHCEYFGATEGLTVGCNVTWGNIEVFGFGVVSFGFIGEILCCVVASIVSTISSFINMTVFEYLVV